MNKLFKKGDIILTVLILLVCIALIFLPELSSEKSVATVYVDGEVIETIKLDEVEKAYTFSPCENVEIEVEKGRIRFLSSDCPDKLCVKSGWLNSGGATSACLPEKVVISVTGEKADFDVITY